MSRRTHAQHMKRLAEKRRRREKVDRYFGGFIVGERFYDDLVRHIDEIAAVGLMEALATPSCDTLTGHMEIRGCEPLPVVGLVPPSSPVTVEPDAT